MPESSRSSSVTHRRLPAASSVSSGSPNRRRAGASQLARLLARFPQAPRYLLANRLTLMGLVALKDVLDDSNADELLERASGLSEPEVRQLVVSIRLGAALDTPVAATVAADQVATSMPREDLQPVTLWIGREFREQLEAVRTLLGHTVPSGKTEEVLLHVLRAPAAKVLERRRHGSPKPSRKTSTAKAAYVPAAVRREVYHREGGSCAYVGEENRRCCSTRRLEYQHVVPLARGGPSTPENVSSSAVRTISSRPRRTSAETTSNASSSRRVRRTHWFSWDTSEDRLSRRSELQSTSCRAEVTSKPFYRRACRSSCTEIALRRAVCFDLGL